MKAAALVPLKFCASAQSSRAKAPARLKHRFLRELQIGVPRAGGEARWAVARVPGMASS